MENAKVICPECGVTLNIKNTEKHMKTQHSSEAVEKRQKLKLHHEAERVRKLEAGKKIITCEICGVSLAFRNIAKHKRKQHSSRNPLDQPKTRELLGKLKLSDKKEKELKTHLKKYPDSTMAHLSEAQKRKQLNRIFGPDDSKTNDLFDKARVLNGGGYGLGKNRKH